MGKLRAFHGKQEIKDFYIIRVKAHAAADEIEKGKYWQDGKGCAVGCTIHSNEHSSYVAELGLPEWLARLEDNLFEALPNGVAKAFPLRFLEAIPVGADLELVQAQFLHWLLVDPQDGVLKFAKSEGVRQAVQGVADCWQDILDGKVVTEERWREVTREAWVAREAGEAWVAWVAWAAGVARAARAARAAGAAGAAGEAGAAWEAWAAGEAGAAWVAREAGVARAAREAWVAWAAWAAGVARAARAEKQAEKLLALLALAD